MKLWLICSYEGATGAQSCTHEDYLRARRAALSEACVPTGEKPLQSEGRAVYISHAPCARISAEALCPGAALTVRGELAEMEAETAPFADAALPLSLRMSLEARKGAAKKAALERAKAFVAALEQDGRDCVLFSHASTIPALLDALRLRGYVARRSKLGAVCPGERILVTSRVAHCGGCGHNCMLSNPGCGVGRDKARRAGIPFTTGESNGTDKR